MGSEMLPEEAMTLAPGFMQFIDVMGQQVFFHLIAAHPNDSERSLLGGFMPIVTW